MKYLSLSFLFAATTIGILPWAAEAQTVDPALQGAWLVTRADHGGKRLDGLTGGTMTVTADRFEIHTAGGSVLKGKLEINAAAKPATMNLLHDSGLRWKAIYEVNGADFQINYVDAAGADPVPTAFRTSPETDATLLSLKRAQQQALREFRDPVSILERKLAAGQAELPFDSKWGYLKGLLQQLDLNPDSQILVFSKTSFQQELISPAKPRALYFNDNVILGVVQDASVYELISVEPDEGLLFFSLDQGKADQPHFKPERGSCSFCHGPINRYAQGVMVATVFPGPNGEAYHPSMGTRELFHLTDHRSPFEERWGGYYVTGTHGDIQHRGNAVAPDRAKPAELDRGKANNVTSLADRFDISKYVEPTSDIVALMTFEHQTMATNILTSVAAQFRANATFPLPAAQLDSEVDRLVSFLLFVGETRMPSPIQGVSTFTETFPKRGPRDAKGRSLRDFDLNTRLFRYPLSYMIYSKAFDGLPADAREKVYRRLYGVLTGAIKGGGYVELDAQRRREILEIVAATKPGLPEYFRVPEGQ
jgi:uncharacterized protein (TIGR03067 family)